MSLIEELKTQQVAHLELSEFSRVEKGATVRMALAQMRDEGHSVCLVVDGRQLTGIFTERDVLTKVVTEPETLDGPVEAVMTEQPITITPDTSAADALRLMDDSRFRNLPVVTAAGELVGDMTHQAIIDYLAARYPIEVLNRPPRPDHYPEQAEGG